LNKIREENGDLDMPPGITPRLVNKGLKQKETPIVLELANKESGRAPIWVESQEWTDGAWEESRARGSGWVAVENREWVAAAVYRTERNFSAPTKTAEWWADLVAEITNRTHEGGMAILIAGDLNGEHEIWMGKLGDKIYPESRRNQRHGEVIAKIAIAAGLYAVVNRNNPETHMTQGRPTAIHVM